MFWLDAGGKAGNKHEDYLGYLLTLKKNNPMIPPSTALHGIFFSFGFYIIPTAFVSYLHPEEHISFSE